VRASYVGWLWGPGAKGLRAEFELVEAGEGYWGLRWRVR
jgi:hypothetical protein